MHVVVGLGEVGLALTLLFKCNGEDKFKNISLISKKYTFLHIAFPWTKNFIEQVKEYQSKFDPTYTIIHSTVPLGVSKKCNANHSPVRGVHPNILEGLKTFVKFIGGPNYLEISQEFNKFGIKTYCTNNSNNTEALKLWDTTQYGVLIELNKEIHEFCTNNDLDFNMVYTEANRTYNEGYSALNRPEVVRPYLNYDSGKIGGHCVIPNSKLFSSESTKLIIKKDKKRK